MTEPQFALSFRPDSYWGGHDANDYTELEEQPRFASYASGLPPLRRGEVEVAGVALASGLGDVYSVRAHRTPSGRLGYLVVDEYGYRDAVRRPLRPEPLTMGELVGLIDGIEDWLEGPFVEGMLDNSWQEGEPYGGDPEELRSFISVLSPFYPELQEYYELRVDAWVEAHRPEGEPAGGKA
jgi:hypothetical protein